MFKPFMRHFEVPENKGLKEYLGFSLKPKNIYDSRSAEKLAIPFCRTELVHFKGALVLALFETSDLKEVCILLLSLQ